MIQWAMGQPPVLTQLVNLPRWPKQVQINDDTPCWLATSHMHRALNANVVTHNIKGEVDPDTY